jgi:hypothetical protein
MALVALPLNVMGRQLLGQNTEFPPRCKCNRNATQSPYRLSDPYYGGEIPFSDYEYNFLMLTCYTIENVGGCDPALKCCNGTQGVEKIEIAVRKLRNRDS